MILLVTGGSGFIGSAFIRYVLSLPSFSGRIINCDSLTYAAQKDALREYEKDPRYSFEKVDITEPGVLFEKYPITHVMHFAAESHVDRSIASAEAFVQTNVVGTVRLLEEVKKRPHIRFHHVSTDEVYGSLTHEGTFTEASLYAPSSPYSASKAASDHFARAYHTTYGLHITISHCSNNYGIFQHDEKLIPVVIRSLCRKAPLPIYGTGENVRDWLHVEDHVRALWTILAKGVAGEVYNIGGGIECSNNTLVEKIIQKYAQIAKEDPEDLRKLITRVQDRKGHDFRYSLSYEKLKRELGWKPIYSLEEGLDEVVRWFAAKYSAPKRYKAVCVIPARLKSTRFPEKILHQLHGKPLVEWTYNAAVSSGKFDKVIIAVDDPKTAAVVAAFTPEYVMTDPSLPNGTARLIALRKEMGISADVWVNWQCDEPLLHVEMMETLLSGDSREAAVWTLKKKGSDEEATNPNVVKVVCTKEDRALYFSRSLIPFERERREGFYKHIGVYAFSDAVLDTIEKLPVSPLAQRESLEQLSFLEEGIPIYAYTTTHEAVGVDHITDVAKVEALLMQKNAFVPCEEV